VGDGGIVIFVFVCDFCGLDRFEIGDTSKGENRK
jgi:hypothetical protein